MKTLHMFLVVVLASFLFSCEEDPGSLKPTHLYLDLPEHPFDYVGTTPEIGTLGRVLFYDTRLSVNNAISCASCHKQSIAFSDNARFSRGFENKLTSRNALPIENLRNAQKLFWDGREQFLSTMVLKPIVNHVEMGMSDLNAIAQRVQSLSYYDDLFAKAHLTKTPGGIATALSAFTGSITSNATRFDNFQMGLTNLNGLELLGKDLFVSKYNCTGCHKSTALSGGYGGGEPIFMNIGLDVNYADNGLGAFNGNASDNGKFKIPNLRNIALTAPYMHDGRFATLDNVLDHYSSGISDHPNLDPLLRDPSNQALRMNISSQEKQALIAFLGTLTDYQMITDPRHSNPFKPRQ